MITSISSENASLSILPRLVAIVHLLFVLRPLVRLFVYHFIVHVPLAFTLRCCFAVCVVAPLISSLRAPTRPSPSMGLGLSFSFSRVRTLLLLLCRSSSFVLGLRAVPPLAPSMASRLRLCDHNYATRTREGTSDLRVTLPHGKRGYVGPPRHTAPLSTATHFREGTSGHRVTLPHGWRGYVGPPRHTAPPTPTTACVRVRRTTESHCPTLGEGTSAHRGTLSRLHFKHVVALRLHWSLYSSCPRPRTSGPRSCTRSASLGVFFTAVRGLARARFA